MPIAKLVLVPPRRGVGGPRPFRMGGMLGSWKLQIQVFPALMFWLPKASPRLRNISLGGNSVGFSLRIYLCLLAIPTLLAVYNMCSKRFSWSWYSLRMPGLICMWTKTALRRYVSNQNRHHSGHMMSVSLEKKKQQQMRLEQSISESRSTKSLAGLQKPRSASPPPNFQWFAPRFAPDQFSTRGCLPPSGRTKLTSHWAAVVFFFFGFSTASF